MVRLQVRDWTQTRAAFAAYYNDDMWLQNN